MAEIKSSDEVRIMLVGDSNVGKTQLLRKFVLDSFAEKYTPTLQLNFGYKDGFMILDAPGKLSCSKMIEMCQDLNAVIFVYDITNSKSFENIKCSVTELSKKSKKKPICYLVGNKKDLGVAGVEKLEAERFAQSKSLTFIEISATDSADVKQLFDNLIATKNNEDLKKESSEKGFLESLEGKVNDKQWDDKKERDYGFFLKIKSIPKHIKKLRALFQIYQDFKNDTAVRKKLLFEVEKIINHAHTSQEKNAEKRHPSIVNLYDDFFTELNSLKLGDAEDKANRLGR